MEFIDGHGEQVKNDPQFEDWMPQIVGCFWRNNNTDYINKMWQWNDTSKTIIVFAAAANPEAFE